MDMRTMDDNMTGPPICSACSKPIYDGTVFKVNGQLRHSSCLRCVACNNIVNQYCHMKGNEVFCIKDFTRLFGAKCASCFKVISPCEAACVTNGNVFHPACLMCATCYREIELGTGFFMRRDHKLVCERDYHRQDLQNRTGSHQSDSESDESGSDETFEHQPACMSYDQQRTLETHYATRKRPTKDERRELCERTGLTNRHIQLWYKNRRAKDKQNRSTNFTSTCTLSQHEVSGYQENPWTSTPKTNQPCRTQSSQLYQAYCPLDFLEPDAMPPNMELCPSDFCNGEVVAGKQNIRKELKEASSHITSAHYVTNNIMSNWLTA